MPRNNNFTTVRYPYPYSATVRYPYPYSATLNDVYDEAVRYWEDAQRQNQFAVNWSTHQSPRSHTISANDAAHFNRINADSFSQAFGTDSECATSMTDNAKTKKAESLTIDESEEVTEFKNACYHYRKHGKEVLSDIFKKAAGTRANYRLFNGASKACPGYAAGDCNCYDCLYYRVGYSDLARESLYYRFSVVIEESDMSERDKDTVLKSLRYYGDSLPDVLGKIGLFNWRKVFDNSAWELVKERTTPDYIKSLREVSGLTIIDGSHNSFLYACGLGVDDCDYRHYYSSNPVYPGYGPGSKYWGKVGACNCFNCIEKRYAKAKRIAEERRQKAANKSKPTGIYVSRGQRATGVEVEFNSDPWCVKQGWRDTWEGSMVITDGSCGYEACTPPLSGKHLDNCITELADKLNENDTSCDERCGLHVHVDCRDFTWPDMYTLLRLYVKIEPALYVIGGQRRADGKDGRNHYCGPCGPSYEKALNTEDKEKKAAVIACALYSRPGRESSVYDRDRAREVAREGIHKKDGGRYKGLNIIPWLAGRRTAALDSTVEFRLHKGTLDSDRIISWCKLLSDIVSWCKTHTEKEVSDLPKSPFKAMAVISPRSKGFITKRLIAFHKHTYKSSVAKKRDRAYKNIGKRIITTVKSQPWRYTIVGAYPTEMPVDDTSGIMEAV